MSVKGGVEMTIKTQNLTLWFYVLLFGSLNSLSGIKDAAGDGLNGVLIQIILLVIFSGLALFALKKRQRAMKVLTDKIDFKSLYQHEWATILIICIGNVIDIFSLTNLSYYIYLIAVFYHLYWFFKNYSIYTKNEK